MRARRFPDAQAAIDGTLEAWLPRLVESNDALIAVLVHLRDSYLSQLPALLATEMTAEIDTALEKALRAQRGC